MTPIFDELHMYSVIRLLRELLPRGFMAASEDTLTSGRHRRLDLCMMMNVNAFLRLHFVQRHPF